MEWLLMFWVGSLVLAPLAASGRGRSAFVWFALALIFGPLALLAVLVMGSATRAASPTDGRYKCPQCAELVMLEAKVCKHCHARLRDEAGQLIQK